MEFRQIPADRASRLALRGRSVLVTVVLAVALPFGFAVADRGHDGPAPAKEARQHRDAVTGEPTV